MDFITQREALLDELNIFSGVVEVRPSDPMSEFANVTFRPEGRGCELTASSGEIGLRSAIEAQVQGTGLINVPVGLLAAGLRPCSGEVVSFSRKAENWVQVRCGKNQMRIPVRAGEPPTLDLPPPEPLCEVETATLRELISTGSYGFPAPADVSVTTAGAQLEVEGSTVRIVSSDHSRLAWASGESRALRAPGDQAEEPEAGAGEKAAFGLNRKTLSLLNQLAASGGDDDRLRFFEQKNHLFFEFGERRILICAKLADRLPEYEHVIPRDCPVRVRVNRAGLRDAAQAAMPFATGDFNRARLEIGEKAIRIHVLSVRGESDGSIEVLKATGAPLTLHANLDHLLDFAKATDTEEVSLEFQSDDKAFLLRPLGGDGPVRHFCVGMPLASG